MTLITPSHTSLPQHSWKPVQQLAQREQGETQPGGQQPGPDTQVCRTTPYLSLLSSVAEYLLEKEVQSQTKQHLQVQKALTYISDSSAPALHVSSSPGAANHQHGSCIGKHLWSHTRQQYTNKKTPKAKANTTNHVPPRFTPSANPRKLGYQCKCRHQMVLLHVLCLLNANSYRGPKLRLQHQVHSERWAVL